MTDLGIEDDGSNSSNLATRCPLHNDRSPSFSINRSNGKWICFAGCGAGSLNRLVELVLGLSTVQAHHWLLGYTETSVSQLKSLLYPPKPESVPVEIIEWDELEREVCPEWFADRGFDVSDIVLWGVHYEPRTGALIIPLQSGFVKRFPPDHKIRYYYSKGLDKKSELFGYYRIIRKTRRLDTLLLTEGSLDTMWAVKAGLDSVAILGASISDYQIYRIGLLNPQEVVFAFDNDEAGRRITNLAYRKMKDKFTCSCIQLPSDVKDIQELPLTQLQTIVKQRMPIISAKLNNFGPWRLLTNV